MKTFTRYYDKGVTVVYTEKRTGNITIIHKNTIIDRFDTGNLSSESLRAITGVVEVIVSRRYIFKRSMIKRLATVRDMPIY